MNGRESIDASYSVVIVHDPLAVGMLEEDDLGEIVLVSCHGPFGVVWKCLWHVFGVDRVDRGRWGGRG